MDTSVTPSYTIRPAIEADAPELARLLTVLGHPTTTRQIQRRWGAWASAGNLALVAVGSDGSLVGLVTLHQTIVLHRPTPIGRITSLVVDESARGAGIGRALVAASEQELKQAGCGLLEITSHVRRVDAHSFYQHIGYEQTSVRLAKSLRDSQ